MPSIRDEPGSDLDGNLGKIYMIYACGFLAAAIILGMAEQLGAAPDIIGLAFVAITLATYLLIGILARTRNAGEYFAAARGVPGVFNGMAMAAQWTSAAGFLGLAGTLYALGFDGLAYPIGLVGGLVLMAVLIVPYLRKLGAYTVPDYFGARFGLPARLLAIVVVCVASFGLLVAQLHAIGFVASRFLGFPYDWGVLAGLAVLVVTTLPGGMKGATWTQVAQYIVLLVALVAPVAMLSASLYGWPPPQFTYGNALQQITTLETGMIEKELASASTLKPALAPFLQVDPVNFLALVVCLMAGTAAMPHLLMRPMTAPTVREARLSVAWAAFFGLLVAITLPAYAAFAKLQVYSLIDKGTAFSALPEWMEKASRRDLVRIHGVSLKLLDDTAAAVKSGAADASAIATHLETRSRDSAAPFMALKETAKSALIDAARATQDLGPGERWDAYRQTVLPAAAKAAGNKTGMLTESGLWIEPGSLVPLLPEMARQPAVISALVAAGALAAALATATGVLIALSSALGHDLVHRMLDTKAPAARRVAVARGCLLIVASSAAYAAVTRAADFGTIVAWAFSLAAAGLFPALVLGIWWKRANAWGAVAGVILGFGLCLYYMAATQYFPLAFHELWAPLVPGSEVAAEKLEKLRAVWSAAEGDAKVAAFSALEALARGTPTSAGAASWFGVPSVAAAVFALPAGFLAVIVVSLLSPRPWPETIALIDEMRVPRGAEVLDQET